MNSQADESSGEDELSSSTGMMLINEHEMKEKGRFYRNPPKDEFDQLMLKCCCSCSGSLFSESIKA